MRRSIFIAALTLAACVRAISAQEQQQQELSPDTTPPPQTSTITVNVRVVGFDALVRDKKGALVHGLTKDAFTLTEDLKPQAIRYFAEDSDLPLTIGLMVDTSGSQRQYFDEQRIASATFLRAMLTNPKDNAFVLRFDNNTLLLQRMTDNFPALQNALGKLAMHFPPRDGVRGGTLLFDSICATSHLAFTADRHRRAVVILTDGEDNGSTKTRDEATACAQLADVAVYTALYTPRDPGPDERDDPRVRVDARDHLLGRTTLERISRATGGRLFVVSRHLTIEAIYAQIQQDLRSQYRLGYTPPPSDPGSYHELLLQPLDKHLKVQTRIGYYTPK